MLISQHPKYPTKKGWRRPSEAILVALRGCQSTFTVSTESSERLCVPHLHIPGATPMSSWVAGAGQYRVDLSLITFVVTIGRR
jgi:hypothetical protein